MQMMRMSLILSLFSLAALCFCAENSTITGDMQSRDRWVGLYIPEEKPQLPFSFIYGGKPSSALLPTLPVKREKMAVEMDKSRRFELRMADHETGLEIRCAAVQYADFPVVEWIVYFKNTGVQNLPILENIQGLNTTFLSEKSGEFAINGIRGDSCSMDSFMPYRIELGVNEAHSFAPAASGKSSDGQTGWPYFNLQLPDGGVILAVGWPGQWAASFTRIAQNSVQIVAGQELTRISLRPGEEVRSPSITLLFWRGQSVVDAQNLWRRWYIAHILPRISGNPQPPVTQIQVDASEADIGYVQKFLDAGIHPDICWRDAGGAGTWYQNSGSPYTGGDAWLNTGTWNIDPAKYPKGFKPFSDWAHSRGMQFLLWFEPERVGDPASWLATKHPEWMLPGTSHGALLNLGDPAARNWLTDHLDSMIKAQGIDWYREDMNGGGPLSAWRKNDAPDRQGMTENLYIQGHLAFWDELRRRNPMLKIDSCASGGRRNDLETMRRAVPLLRSDFQWPQMPQVVEGNQCHTYGLSSWLPFQGTGVYLYDAYSFRSFYLTGFGMGTLTPENAPAQKQAYTECARVAPYMLGDYYPLTPYSIKSDSWIAWQFDRTLQGDGLIQAFRRPDCNDSSMTLVLNGIDPNSRYEVTDIDHPKPRLIPGSALAQKGLNIEISVKPGAALIIYRKIK